MDFFFPWKKPLLDVLSKKFMQKLKKLYCVLYRQCSFSYMTDKASISCTREGCISLRSLESQLTSMDAQNLMEKIGAVHDSNIFR